MKSVEAAAGSAYMKRTRLSVNIEVFDRAFSTRKDSKNLTLRDNCETIFQQLAYGYWQ